MMEVIGGIATRLKLLGTVQSLVTASLHLTADHEGRLLSFEDTLQTIQDRTDIVMSDISRRRLETRIQRIIPRLRKTIWNLDRDNRNFWTRKIVFAKRIFGFIKQTLDEIDQSIKEFDTEYKRYIELLQGISMFLTNDPFCP